MMALNLIQIFGGTRSFQKKMKFVIFFWKFMSTKIGEKWSVRFFLKFWISVFWISVFWISGFWISGFLNFWLLNFWLLYFCLFRFLPFEFLPFWISGVLKFCLLNFCLFEFLLFWISVCLNISLLKSENCFDSRCLWHTIFTLYKIKFQ